MSKLKELIYKLCPDGVEYKKLGEVSELFRGKVYSKGYIRENHGIYPIYSSQTANNGELGRISSYDYDGEYLTWTTDGAYAGTIFHRKGKFSITNVCGLIKITTKSIDIRFLYFWLSIKAKDYVYRGMGNPKLMSNQMAKIEIPLPPIEVQEEIVRILDNFTKCTAELQAELQAREEQYEYYRNKLLSFEGRTDVEYKKLGEVCMLSKERIGVNELNADNYVSVENLLPNKRGKIKASNIPKEGNCIKFEANDILVGNIRPYLHKIWFANCIGGTNGDVLCFKIKEEMRPIIKSQYLYCILSSNSFFEYDNNYAKGAKMPRGDKQKIMEYTFPIPSLNIQERIVNILDKFETLVKDLSQGLPAEIEARQNQYEFYRNRLLSFKRLTT